MNGISMNELTTYRWSFEEDVQRYAAAGLDAIGVWRQKLSDFGEEKGAELLAEHRLRVSSLNWAGGFTGSEGRSFKESVDDAREALRTARLLKSPCVIVYTGARAGHTHKHARRLLRTALAELAEPAAQMGVDLAIEPMHAGCAAEWTFLTSLDESLALLDELDSPAVKLVFDCYHLGHEPSIVQRIADLAPRTAIVQLGDARRPPSGEQDRCPLGEGCLPLADIVAEFQRAGYRGDFDIELLGEEIEVSDYGALIAQSHRAARGIVGGE